jgi:hypothetical protein
MPLDGPRSESSRKPRLEQHAYPVWGLVIKRATYVGVGQSHAVRVPPNTVSETSPSETCLV